MLFSRHHQGFTLLELIIVIAIMALVTTGTLMLNRGGYENKQLETETTRFMRMVSLASDLSTLTGHILGIYVEPQRYRFMVYEQTQETQEYQWQWLQEARFKTDVTLPQQISVELNVESGFWPDLESENAKSNTLVLNRDEFSLHHKGKDPLPTPQIEIEPTGLMTPFALQLTWQTGSQSESIRLVQASRLGQLTFKDKQAQ